MRVIGNHPAKAERSKTSQAQADWLSADDLARHFHTSIENVKEALYDLGHACRDSKKPTQESLRIGVARLFKAHGKDLYKWDRKTVVPELAPLFPH